MGSSRSFGFSTFKRTVNCWLKMSGDVIATLTSASFGTATLGVLLQAVRHSTRAHTAAPNNLFIDSPLRDLGDLGESLSLLHQTRRHVARHQRDAALTHIEPPRIFFRIDTDVRARRHG